VIVSDTTTPIILMETGRWELLSNLFYRVSIPKAVYEELLCKDEGSLPDFFEIIEIRDDPMLETLKMLLDRGESEAIVLALRLGQPLIIDEKKGRKIARRYGIEIVGLLGIVYLNVKKGRLDAKGAFEFLDEVQERGFRISESLLQRMKQKVKQA